MVFSPSYCRGALLTYLLMGEVGPVVLENRCATLAGAQAWAAFLFASYLFFHLVFLLGSWLDEFYDWARRYVPSKTIGGPLRASGDRYRCSKCQREINWVDIVSSALDQLHSREMIARVIPGEQKLVNTEAQT